MQSKVNSLCSPQIERDIALAFAGSIFSISTEILCLMN